MSAAGSVRVDTIPAELRALAQWVAWREETRDGKPTRVPYRVDRLSRASTTDPASWATFEAALAASDRFDGIGFVLAEGDGFVGVDLDGCVDPLTLDLTAEAAAIVAALDSYAELSPSGLGVHVFVRGTLNGRRNRRGAVEMYERDRFLTVTGEHLRGTPDTIEERQAQLEEVHAHVFGEAERERPPAPVAPVDLDDLELLEKARTARNGDRFERLWRGDSSEYPSQSEADLALCSILAFWTGRDAGRIERLFRSSGLYREKWERDDYREGTISTAIAGTSEAYEQVRPESDALRTHPASAPESEVESASVIGGASLRPDGIGTHLRTHLPQLRPVGNETPSLVVAEAGEFAAVEEASAEPRLGDATETVLSAGGIAAWYGDGGAGKTTLGLDQAVHLCAGADWIGLPVPRACTVLWIENEGPRGKFREKLRAKLDAWEGPDLERRLHVLEQPWSLFTFADVGYRDELVAVIRDLGIDVVFAGPVARLGLEGGGTPAQIQLFVNLLEQVRADLERPLAYELINHENKAGDVSGAWAGATDTLAHVQARGNGHTAIVWRKVRWASELHGRTWKLTWGPGEAFEIDETPETTDDAIADQLADLVRDAPGQSWNSYSAPLTGNGQRKRLVRDQLLEEGLLVNLGTPKAMRLYLSEQVDTLPLDEEARCVQAPCKAPRVPGSYYCAEHGGSAP